MTGRIIRGLSFWGVFVALPLAVLAWHACTSPGAHQAALSFGELAGITTYSVAIAAAIAFLAVLAGCIPARIFGTAAHGRTAMFVLLCAPLLLPRYVLYYLWLVLLSPTTTLGAWLGAQSPGVMRAILQGVTFVTLALWYWPLAALVISQGWRRIDAAVWQHAQLDCTGPLSRLRIAASLLRPSLIAAFVLCVVCVLGEFGTFHLAGMQTIGTELAVVYQLTGSTAAVARAAIPLVAAALLAALVLDRTLGHALPHTAHSRYTPRHGVARWVLCGLLLTISLAVPVLILMTSIPATTAFGQFLPLQREALATTFATAAAASGIALLIAWSSCAVHGTGPLGTWLARCMHVSVFFMMFAPGSLVATALIHTQIVLGLPRTMTQSIWVVAAGQAVRFAGVALVLLRVARSTTDTGIAALADLDGADRLRRVRYITLPLYWPLYAGAFLVVVLLALTELPVTLLLLPPGVPSFTQRLLNQMHYARDQHVLASCALLLGGYAVLAVAAVLLCRLRLPRMTAPLAVILGCCVAGCTPAASQSGAVVLHVFGRTGKGDGEFLYPRAIARAPRGELAVVDKTGRIQWFSPKGEYRRTIHVPAIDAGKPTGIHFGPDGTLYVADTHYHRILKYAADGAPIGSFGSYGEAPGQFIYPTDVAVAPNGELLVSEYGGNDRISVFSREGTCSRTFGSPGTARGQLSRPSALCIDPAEELLYVADACNHRIAVYGLDGTLRQYIGELGTDPGKLRYPYDITRTDDGRLVVCEYGNNRIQVLTPDGRCLAVYGTGGRDPGYVAFPWGVAVDAHARAFVVDAGNNRIQVWQL